MNHHLLFINSPIVGLPGFCQVLTIMNKLLLQLSTCLQISSVHSYFFFHSRNSAPLSHSTGQAQIETRGQRNLRKPSCGTNRESDNNLKAGVGVIKKKRSPVLTSRGFPSTKDICRNHETLKSVSNKLWSWLMWDLVKEEMTVNWADQWEGGRDETGPGGWPFYFCIPVATCTRPSHLSLQVLQQLNPPPWKAFSSPFLPSAHWVPPTHCSVLFQGQLLWGTLWPPRTC